MAGVGAWLRYAVIGGIGVIVLVGLAIFSGAFRSEADTGSMTATLPAPTVLAKESDDAAQQPSPTPEAIPVVSDLKIFNNAAERRETEFEGGERFLSCFTLRPGGDGQLTVVATDRDEKPEGTEAPGVRARSQAFGQISGPVCQEVGALDGGLPPGEYWAWVLYGGTELARNQFRVLEPPPVVAATVVPSNAASNPSTPARPPAQSVPVISPTQRPPQQAASSNVIPNPTLAPAATQAPPPPPAATPTAAVAYPTAAPATATAIIVNNPPPAAATAIVAPPVATPPPVVATQPPQGACTQLLDGRLRCLQDP
jgi:hypothetical protein